MAAKIGNNAVSHAVMVVLLEAAAMVQSAGVSTSAFAEMLMGEGSGLTRPLTHRLRERVLGGEYEGGMPTEAARKDSVLALRLAEAGQVPMFVIQAAHSVYEIAVAQGLGRDDYAAVAKLWASLDRPPVRVNRRPVAPGGLVAHQGSGAVQGRLVREEVAAQARHRVLPDVDVDDGGHVGLQRRGHHLAQLLRRVGVHPARPVGLRDSGEVRVGQVAADEPGAEEVALIRLLAPQQPLFMTTQTVMSCATAVPARRSCRSRRHPSG